MTLNLTSLTYALAALLLLGSVSAQKYSSAEELIAAVNARPEPTTVQATLTMVITTANGQELTREMRTWTSGKDDRIIKFTSPADIAGSGFLITKVSGMEERMVYLPALGRVRRIAGGQSDDAFFGSDFSYQDIAGIDQDDYTHEMLEVRDGPTYVVAATPKAESGSSYDQLVLELPEATLVPSRVEYYRGGLLAKVLTVSGLTELNGYVIPTERRMESVTSGEVSTYTTIRQAELLLDEPLPGDLFTERFLRR